MGQYMSLDPKYKTINISKYIHSLIYITNIDFLTIHTHTGPKGQSVNLLPYNVKICSQLDCPNVQTLTKPQGTTCAPLTSHPNTSKAAEPCPKLRWNSIALEQSLPACRQVRDLSPGCTQTVTTPWMLSHQDPLHCSTAHTRTSSLASLPPQLQQTIYA